MKKIKAILLLIVSFFCIATLVSCGKKANIEIINISTMRTKIGVTIKVDDPKSYITSGSITATLYETGSDNDKVDTITFDSLDEEEQTQTFTDLEKETTYKLVIKATIDDKSKTYYNKKVTTSNEGISAENPIHITNAEELKEMTYDTDAYYVLDKDIDFTTESGEKTTVTPMFDSSNKFEGHLDGNNHTIKGYKLSSSDTYLGLFGFLEVGSTIKNLKVSDVEISSTKGSNVYIGSLVASNKGTITNVVASNINIEHLGQSTSKAIVGGLVGENSGIIENSGVDTATIKTRTRHENFVGGLVGTNGGIVQNSIQGAHIASSYAKNVTIENNLASVVVVDKESSKNAAFFTYVGGLVGETRLNITDSYADAKIKTEASAEATSVLETYEVAVGGFAGRIVNCSKIEACVSNTTLNVTSNDAYKFYVGVFAGEVSDSNIKSGYAVLSGANSVISKSDHSADTKYDSIKDACDVPSFDVIAKKSKTFDTDVTTVENLGYFLATEATIAVDDAEVDGHLAIKTTTNVDATFEMSEMIQEFLNSVKK